MNALAPPPSTPLAPYASYRPHICAHVLTHPRRHTSEDAIWVDECNHTYAIVDGVSSELGAMASELALFALHMAMDHKSADKNVGALMQFVNQALMEENRRLLNQSPIDTLGTSGTLSANQRRCKLLLASSLIFQCTDNVLHYSHLGDCRLMLWREGVLINLTEDHTLLQEAIAHGRLPDDETLMVCSPLRHVLTECLGEWHDAFFNGSHPLRHDDVVIAASDGLTHTLTHSHLEDIVRAHAPCAQTLPKLQSALMQALLDKGLDDDASLILMAHAD